MKGDVWLGALLSIPIAIYTGIALYRWNRFEQLRTEVKRIILAIDFMDERTRIAVIARKEVGELVSISSDLFQLGHHEAGEAVSGLFQQIGESIYLASHGKLSFDVFAGRYSDWQWICRRLRPSQSVIWNPKPKF